MSYEKIEAESAGRTDRSFGSEELEKSFKLFQRDLLSSMSDSDAIKWVEKNSGQLRELVTGNKEILYLYGENPKVAGLVGKNLGILDSYREKPDLAMNWLRQELHDPYAYH